MQTKSKSAPAGAEQGRALHVARQSILDARGKVFGYELLYRAAAGDTTCTADRNLAGARVLTDAVLDLGLETLTGGHQAFINLTRPLLLSKVSELIPAKAAVFELLEDIVIDAAVIEVCREMHAQGYRLALDDFLPNSRAEALLPYVSYVKVDVLTTRPEVASNLVARLAPTGVKLVAEKVETRAAFEQARLAGYDFFQGYYFCRPVTTSGTGIPTEHVRYLRLLSALNRPGLTIGAVEELVKQDAALSLRVLRCVNSAAFAIRKDVRSIREALVLLGIDPIRRWASVWCLAGLSAGQTSELATLALLRARSCELLGDRLDDVEDSELFLVGLCSLLDVMLSRTMADALAHLPLSTTTERALLGHPSALRSVLEAVIAYEGGAWDEAESTAREAGVPESMLPQAYTGALSWASEMARALVAA